MARTGARPRPIYDTPVPPREMGLDPELEGVVKIATLGRTIAGSETKVVIDGDVVLERQIPNISIVYKNQTFADEAVQPAMDEMERYAEEKARGLYDEQE